MSDAWRPRSWPLGMYEISAPDEKVYPDWRIYLYPNRPPPAGTILLDNQRWVRVCELWDGYRPPSSWKGNVPPRLVLAERTFPSRFRFRGEGFPERVALSRVTPPP